MKKKAKRKNKTPFFQLTWRKAWIAVVTGFVAIILHNLIYALFYSYFQSTGGDEPFFFIIAVVLVPLYLIISIIYSLIKWFQKKY